ncbi:tyrosine kinase receptor Cad96Ca isoform X2 [Arctopsyche grandis]|uniref:tyrosine kinase receptor Cad96Ca isoform X2 n=1 Tax=Arctopsyche grandis TaxID=121162 RepID=UPI00406D919A
MENFWSCCSVRANVKFAYVIVVAALCCPIPQAQCQGSDNTPPVMWLDRNWRIPYDEAVGSVVTRVQASDGEHDPLVFGLEPLNRDIGGNDHSSLPFKIDNITGVVYLNESLKDKAGKNIFLYVTVSDGKLTAKNEIWVNVVNSTGRDGGPQGGYFPSTANTRGSSTRNRPPFLPLPGFDSRPRAPPLPPNFGQFPSIGTNQPSLGIGNPIQNGQESKTTLLLPLNPLVPKFQYPPGTRHNFTSNRIDDIPVVNNEISRNVTESAAEPVSGLTITIIPVTSIFAIFIIIGVMAVIFRRKICPTRISSKKADMSKDPSGGIVLQEAPSLALQGWRGPRAFSNRYEPSSENANHFQTSSVGPETKEPVDRWEFPRHRLKVFDILGEGAFGQVWRCEATDIDGKLGPTTVAVKTLKENANDKERSDLLSELQVMKNLEPHPNVVRLIACCTEKEPIFVIMEFITLGKLQAFLRSSRAERHYGNVHAGSETLTSRDLTSFVYQVARGMEFLSSKGIIHRDLAARNILITEDHICKVADFGFARDVVTSLVYERKSEGRLPIRWMAPESLYDDIFSVKSDVWSFGVLIWEVVTLGSTPYPGLSAGEVMRKVRDGYRLEKPEHCRRELYNIMFYCWDKDPAERPTFSECVTLLERLLMTETDYIELERFPDHSYYNVASLSGEKV